MPEITITGYTFSDTTQKIDMVVLSEDGFESPAIPITEDRTSAGNFVIFFNEVKPYDYTYTINVSKATKAILDKFIFILEKQSESSPLITVSYKSFSNNTYKVFIKEISSVKLKGNNVYDITVTMRRLE